MSSKSDSKKEPVEYRYSVEAVALETFVNLVSRQGIDMVHTGVTDDRRRTFTSDRLLDMKSLKARGIIRSYTISKVTRVEETLEEG